MQPYLLILVDRRLAMCIMTETTPIEVLNAVGLERKNALAQVFGAECEQIVIQHLAILKQKITLEPVLLDILELNGSPDRILVKKESCKSASDHCPCSNRKRKYPSVLNETDITPAAKRAQRMF